MATAADEPAQALKDRVAGELKEYERGREVYANRKFFEYEQATQNEKKIMGMVGQSERAATIPRPGEWVVQAPLKVKAGRKWNASQSLSSLRDSMDGSNAKSRRSRPRPFPTGRGPPSPSSSSTVWASAPRRTSRWSTASRAAVPPHSEP